MKHTITIILALLISSTAYARDTSCGSPICASAAKVQSMALDFDTAAAALAAHEAAEQHRADIQAADARDEAIAQARAEAAPRVVSDYHSSSKIGDRRYETVSQTVRENGTYHTETQSQVVHDPYAVTYRAWQH